MPLPRPLPLVALLGLAACAGSPVEQPITAPAPPARIDTLPLAFLHEPTDATHLSIADGRLSIRLRVNPGRVLSAAVVGEGTTSPMQRQALYRGQEVWRGTLPEATTRYAIRIETAGGPTTFGPFTVPTAPFRALPWVGRAVGYQIFPERFWNGDPSNDTLALTTDEHVVMPQWTRPVLRPWRGAPVTDQLCCHEYFGGDLAGITQRLDSLAALGVTLLYLNPIASAGSAHGYDTWDYLTVEPSMGSAADLRTLLDRAHARGMRVLFDFVPNHVGLGFPRFQEALRAGPASPSWAWFTFLVPAAQLQAGNPAHYATFGGSGAMPKLNTATPEVQAHLLDAARHWLRFGFDGVRVDVPNELPNAAAFAQALRQAARGVKADAYLVGEIWRRAPAWVQGDQYDALMNYAVGQDIIEPFVRGTMSAADAAVNLGLVLMEYPEASTAMAFNVIATHDTPRLLTKLGAGSLQSTPSADQLARQRLASAMLYALPGVPVTFQGDECAFTGAMNENRYPVQWDQCDATMRAHYRRLATLRTGTPALQSAAMHLVSVDGGLLAWLRGDGGSGDVLALFNNGLAPASTQLPAGVWTDLADGTSATSRVEVPGLGWRYLRRQ